MKIKNNYSYFTLGTVQLGLKYGISNTTGMPGRQEALAILDQAVRDGVNTFDTSYSYGTSEDVIGDYLTANSSLKKDIFITSKMPKIVVSDDNEIKEKVKQYILSSRERLKVDIIDTYMIHDASDVCSYKGKVVESLVKAKEEGLIRRIGVSVYFPEEALRTLDIPDIEVVQIPLNVFDSRFYSQGILKKLDQSGKIVFARSIFLQGLFFVNKEDLLIKIPEAHIYNEKLKGLSEEFAMEIDELAVRFVRSFDEIENIVLGAETIAQVKRNAFLSRNKPMSEENRDKVIKSFLDVPEIVYLPIKWKKS